jgi:hypothetical protein
MATGYWAGRSRDLSSSPYGVKNSIMFTSFKSALGPTMGTGALSSGVKRPGNEADHSPQTNVQAKHCGTILVPPLSHTSSELRGLSPRAYYTDLATATCRRR